MSRSLARRARRRAAHAARHGNPIRGTSGSANRARGARMRREQEEQAAKVTAELSALVHQVTTFPDSVGRQIGSEDFDKMMNGEKIQLGSW